MCRPARLIVEEAMKIRRVFPVVALAALVALAGGAPAAGGTPEADTAVVRVLNLNIF